MTGFREEAYHEICKLFSFENLGSDQRNTQFAKKILRLRLFRNSLGENVLNSLRHFVHCL